MNLTKNIVNQSSGRHVVVSILMAKYFIFGPNFSTKNFIFSVSY